MSAHVRLLICNTCGTIEELPDYKGPEDRDDVLNFLSSQHKFPDGNTHFGNLGRVETKHWESKDKREAIVSQIRDRAGHTGLDPTFYDAKNTLQEDAMTCWTRDHNRIPACSDYMSEAKRLSPGTTSARKEAGIKEPFRSTTFLCHFCPVHSLVTQAAHDKSGVRN